MKKYLVIILIVVFTLITISCEDFLNSASEGKKKSKNFWAWDYTKSPVASYSISAELLASNELCEVWVEKGSGVSAQQAKSVAEEYKNVVYVRMMKFLGWQTTDGYNVMDIADLLGDGNEKLIILLLDIKDGYETKEDAYVAGYFYARNFIEAADSNLSDMIYMDTYPSKVGSEEFYSTLAHEMQHLINFVTTAMLRSEIDNNGYITELYFMDTWIDEGLSAAAEWVYLGKPDENRIQWYNLDRTGLISEGDNFYVWDNHRDIPNAIINEYATVSLFFQWLRLQFKDDIYYKILISEDSDYKAVEKAVKETHSYNWSELIGTWHAANFVNNASSIYGYKDDSLLKKVKANYIDNKTTSWPLYPGEAVYSYSSAGRTLPANSQHIRYSGMSTTSVLSNVPAGGALLAYNIDTGYGADGKSPAVGSGTTTGNTPPKKSILNQESSADSRALGANVSAGSNRIDAGDIIRRNGVVHSNSSRSIEVKEVKEVKQLPKISRENITRYNASNE